MKKFLGFLVMMVMGVTMMTMPAMAEFSSGVEDPTQGSGCDTGTFLWMRPWYYGLQCENGAVSAKNFTTEDDNLRKSITSIVLVVIYDISVIVGIVAAGFLIYGGIQYIYSRGDAGSAAKGKKTITSAVVGMAISMVANVAINTIGRALVGGNNQTSAQVGSTGLSLYNIYEIQPEDMIQTVVNFALGAATLVAVGFIIYAGITMSISYGDPGKIQKGKKSIQYAIVGLIVAMGAFALVNFAGGGLNTAISESGDKGLFEVVNNVFGVIVGVTGFVSVAGVVVGGVQYMSASGDATKVQKGKHTVTYSIVGLIITVLAGAVVSFVINNVFNS